MNPARREKMGDAAQDRLMVHYRERGWTVQEARTLIDRVRAVAVPIATPAAADTTGT